MPKLTRLKSAVACSFISCFLFAHLIACESKQPACPNTTEQKSTKSAGCLVIDQQRVLVIEGITGKISTPGGSSKNNESSQCTAHRETWEETGLDVIPGNLVAVWPDDFHMYECTPHKQSSAIGSSRPLEVKRVFWLPVDRFDEFNWRFEGQKEWLIERLRDH